MLQHDDQRKDRKNMRLCTPSTRTRTERKVASYKDSRDVELSEFVLGRLGGTPVRSVAGFSGGGGSSSMVLGRRRTGRTTQLLKRRAALALGSLYTSKCCQISAAILWSWDIMARYLREKGVGVRPLVCYLIVARMVLRQRPFHLEPFPSDETRSNAPLLRRAARIPVAAADGLLSGRKVQLSITFLRMWEQTFPASRRLQIAAICQPRRLVPCQQEPSGLIIEEHWIPPRNFRQRRGEMPQGQATIRHRAFQQDGDLTQVGPNALFGGFGPSVVQSRRCSGRKQHAGLAVG
ncbi:hypothetical protein PSPO01_09595 [Paraphaeosphaeria sporulosa]